MRAAVVELGSRRSGCTDGADDLVALLDHDSAAEEYDMRQLGEGRNRIFALRALSQGQGVALERYAGIRLVVRAIERMNAGAIASQWGNVAPSASSNTAVSL